MRKETNYSISLLFLMGVFLVLASSCNKDDNIGIPILTTTNITDITHSTAISGGNITSNGGSTLLARGVCWSTNEDPSVSDNKTSNGTEMGSFISDITGLSPNTTYYVRAFAMNRNGTGYGNTTSFTTVDDGSTFTDPRDGNVYKIVTIGNQTWMAENLRYLPSVSGPGTLSPTTSHYYVYGYDGTDVNTAKAEANYTTYGVLYNWHAAMDGAAGTTQIPSGVQGACPPGWHLPSDPEWYRLTSYLGGLLIAGGKLKALTHWIGPNVGATNEFGFTALPGGYMDESGQFKLIGFAGYWWTATKYNSTLVNNRAMYSDDIDLSGYAHEMQVGSSCRCVKD